MVQDVCKRALEPKAQTLADLKRLRQSSRDSRRAWADKNAHSTVPDSASIRRRICKRIGIEILQRGGVRQVAVADAVGP